MDLVRLALIGAGTIGTRHAQHIAESPEARLVAVCDPAPAGAALAERLGAQHHADLASLFAAGGLDGVVVATPTATHADVGSACAAQGLHLLVEKPIAASNGEAQRLVQAAREAGVHLMVGHHRRFNPLVEAARELVRGGALGRLVAVSALWAQLKHAEYYDVAWRTEPGGGPVLTNLVHDLDLLRWVCGDIERIHGEASSAVRNHAVEDTAAVLMRFSGGAVGTIVVSDATPSPWSYEANSGENADFAHEALDCYQFLGSEASLAFPSMTLWRYADPQRNGWAHPLARDRHTVQPGEPLVRQLAHFCRVIRGEEPPRTSGEDGARTLAATLGVLEAAASGKAVALEPRAG